VFRPRIIALILVAAVVVSIAATGDETGKAPRRSVYPTQLPDSAGKAIAERACLMCHSATLITQQAKDSTGWEKSLAQMERWGVRLTFEERDSLHAYLMSAFPARP
jgi:cytochrome c5